MNETKMLESAIRCLDRALDAMNRAVEMTTTEGPAVAIEFIYRCSQAPHPGVEFYGPDGGCAECGYKP